MKPRRLQALTLWLLAGACVADNPLVSHVYTADPAARVFNGRMYVITSHDLDGQANYDMVDYHLFSSDDMINWRDHGVVFDVRTNTTWATRAYAPDMIARNGRYYLYFPDGANSIGVAVADSPTGPWSDPLGRPLVTRSTPGANVSWLFDPGVFLDDDGQAYLYFGGGGPGNARVIRLNSDMISTNGSAIAIDVPNFFEALYMHKRNGVYYLSYSTTPEAGMRIDYMTSNNPVSGFTYRGTLLPNPWQNGNNNHQSIVEHAGQWYVFYHNRAIANERGASIYQRSINVDRMFYNADGSIQQVANGPAGVPKLRNVDPSLQNEAESIDNEQGIEMEGPPNGTRNLAFIENGDWVQISNVDFGATGFGGFEARVASATSGGAIDIVLDNLNNAPIGRLNVPGTGGWQSWQVVSGSINRVTGLHNVFLRFAGGSGYLLNLDWWRFTGGNPGGSSVTVELEGLSGQSGFSPFIAGSDGAASGGRFIEWPNNGANQLLAAPSDTASGRVEISFTLSQSANVGFDMLANLPNASDDSFYYKLDGGAWLTQNNMTGGGWQTYRPTTFNNLAAGSHTLRILRREDGARLDKVTLTASAGTIALGGGSTGSVTLQENATGFCGVDGTIDTNQAGFTGSGFANTNNVAGAAVRWRVGAAVAGSYTLQWRHANGTTADRTGSVRINGANVASLSLPGTGSWTSWTSSASATVMLNAGVNDVHLLAATANGLSNIDSLTVSGSAGIDAMACN